MSLSDGSIAYAYEGRDCKSFIDSEPAALLLWRIEAQRKESSIGGRTTSTGMYKGVCIIIEGKEAVYRSVVTRGFANDGIDCGCGMRNEKVRGEFA